jgi:hypothetical protein
MFIDRYKLLDEKKTRYKKISSLCPFIISLPTRLVSWVSIIKLWTCFSALVSSSLRDTTATSSAVHPAPYDREQPKLASSRERVARFLEQAVVISSNQ